MVAVDQETLQATRRRYGIEGPVVVRRGITQPSVREVA
jgi:hypothetical protein